MKVKVFYPNENGKIELTKQELEKLLDEAYKEGYSDSDNKYNYPWTISTPVYRDKSSVNSIELARNLEGQINLYDSRMD